MTTNEPPVIVTLRACWEVTAGLLPGRAEPEYTRRFNFTSAHSNDQFVEIGAEATRYAASLIDPNRLNWVRIDWVWF